MVAFPFVSRQAACMTVSAAQLLHMLSCWAKAFSEGFRGIDQEACAGVDVRELTSWDKREGLCLWTSRLPRLAVLCVLHPKSQTP